MDGWWALFIGRWWTNVEADAEEWLALADALETRTSCSFKRAAYDPKTGRMRSPRNTVSDRDQPFIEGAEGYLAAHIRETVT